MDWRSLPFGLVAAPSNLGLRPPEPGAVPGTGKAPEALREAGLHSSLGFPEFGVVLPGRYLDDVAPAVPRLRNQDAIVDHARRLADRLTAIVESGHRPVVLGGDCSLLVAAGVALKRRGRFGLVHVDGHTDFRHPGNSDRCASLAGEDLAAAIGLHWPAIGDIDGLAPYFRPQDAVQVGCRDDDEHLAEVREVIAQVIPASAVRHDTPHRVLAAMDGLDGYWLHLDVDVLDPQVMPAVDSPDAGGLDVEGLRSLLGPLVRSAVGVQVCVYDPDLDPDGRSAEVVKRVLVEVLTADAPQPPR